MRDELRALSAEIGADHLLVQAAGGNTSIKQDGVMWIKASGTWLRDALTKDIFVPLDLASLHAALMRDDPACEACTDFVRDVLNQAQLRPSIETSVHGLMPQAVVLHVHCVNTIAWAIQTDAQALLAPILAGLPWAFVPYARPGLQLSRAIRSVMRPDTSVLILQNHGLAVAAETVGTAAQLLREVVRRLERPVHPLPPPNTVVLEQAAHGSHYHLPTDTRCHGFALNPWSCRLGAAHVYYPDHAVFLGASIPAEISIGAAAVVVPGAGVLVHHSAKPSVEPMLACLTEVFARLTEGSDLRSLTPADIGALLNWDAEKYRQALRS